MDRSIRRHQVLLVLAVAMGLMLAAWSAHTWAQSAGDMPTYGQIQDAGSGADDKARNILNNMLGEFGQNPFAAVGPPTELLGRMFFIFNACLFVVGASWVGYHCLSGIAQTAHEGEVLGKRLSTLWLPIRMTMGVGGMLPIFGGFSLAQAIMMSVGILGIGIANLLTTSAIDSAANFEALVPPPAIAQGVGTVGFTGDLGRDLFEMHVCTILSNDYRSRTEQPQQEITFDGTKLIAPDSCGSITIVTHGSGPRSGFSMLGFRNAAVDYIKIAAIAVRTNEQYPVVLTSVNESIRPLAQAWVDTYAAEDAQTHMRINPVPPYPDMDVAKVMIAAQQRFLSEVRGDSKEDQSLKGRALANMKEGGWATIGSWYSTFAEMNAAIQTAMTQTTLQVQSAEEALAVTGGERIESVSDGLISLGVKAHAAVSGRTSDYCDDPGLGGSVSKIISTGTATGDCSAGESIILAMNNGVAGDSGGTGMVNPLIAAKNLGDWLIVAVQGAYVASVAIRSTPLGAMAGMAKEGGGKVATESKGSTGVSKAAGLGKIAKVMGPLGTVISDFFEIAPMILGALLVIGMILSFYVPFIPFITWFTGLVSYFASFIEGLIAAQIWAFSHLHAEGEGLGQRTEKGYLYILNMLLRPGLMVLGFFFASATSVLVGTLLYQMFGPALANVQGNSSTGVLSIIGFFCVFLLLLIMMLQILFNLIYELPDRVIAWFGSGMEARMAKELDHKLEGSVQTFARWGGQAAKVM